MHELPKDLTNSLRSYRGSVYGRSRNSAQPDEVDLEKGLEGFGGLRSDQPPNPTSSSLILHPTKSTHGLNQIADLQEHRGFHQDFGYPNPSNNAATRSNRKIGSPSKGVMVSEPMPPQSATTAKQSIFQLPRLADPDPAADRLDDDPNPLSSVHFYELMGLRQPDPGHLTDPNRLMTDDGLYGKIHKSLASTQMQYQLFNVLTYLLLGVQILLSALFIVLGSIRGVDTHTPIVVLGAVATVIGGTLALMQGQGLPNRLRQTRDNLRNVVFVADELYWDFSADRPVFFKDIRKIREDYLRVLEEARRNHPDTWNQASDTIARGSDGRRRGGRG